MGWDPYRARGEGTGSLRRRDRKSGTQRPKGPEVAVVVGLPYRDTDWEMQGREVGKETG